MSEENSEAKPVTAADLQKAIAKEISLFLDENRELIIKRAKEKLNIKET